MRRFDHEKLGVYTAALDWLTTADAIAEALPRGRGYLADQLRRAATSVVLNIAEGAGEFARDEKARFYRMARRSATECAAVVDVGSRLELIAPELAARGRGQLLDIVSMLVRLARSVGESRRDG